MQEAEGAEARPSEEVKEMTGGSKSHAVAGRGKKEGCREKKEESAAKMSHLLEVPHFLKVEKKPQDIHWGNRVYCHLVQSNMHYSTASEPSAWLLHRSIL